MSQQTLVPHSNTNTPVKAMGSYKTLVIRSVEEFQRYRDQWTSLLQKAHIQNLTMSHGWLVTWLKHFPAMQLAVVIVLDENNEWIAGAPFKISRLKKGVGQRLLRHLHFIGSHPTVFDWMRIAIATFADEQEVINRMATALLDEPWDLMALAFNDHRPSLELLQQAFAKRSVQSEIEASMILPYIPLPDNEETYKAQRSKRTNTKLRHCYNRFEKQMNTSPQLVFQPYTSEGLLDVFVDGHIQYWGDQGLPSLFTRFPTVRQFYKDMLRYGQTEAHDDDPKLAFTTLEANQEVMSYHFGFLQGKNFLCHITHYDETHKFYTPGLVHMDRSIFYTLAKQGTRFEFGRGDEPYKKLWTETSYPLWSMVAYRNIAAKALWKGDLGIKRLLKKPIGDLEP